MKDPVLKETPRKSVSMNKDENTPLTKDAAVNPKNTV